RCTAKRKFDSIVCGDFITWHHNLHGNASIDDLLPRTNALTRPGYRGRPRTIAANIDLLVVVNSWLPETSWNLVDRYLIAAEQLNAEAIVVMNKSDLAKSQATDEDWEAMKAYQEIGYPVLEMNAVTGEGIDELSKLMQNKTSIFSGRSGVGKSSIANKILPESDILTGLISDSGEGKHTTTTATLYGLENDGYLIDSPGVRDYALGDISETDLAEGYIEFIEYQDACRFHNCTHDHEPKCAIRNAVNENKINKNRYLRYIDALRNRE
ncbi:UNVERIFIED_CONTAM: hypothetical protein GTU68_021777, partial [Idotea baltica]|nr:hypothetical protein [Idotea baltica]